MGATSLGHVQTMHTREWAALDHSMTLRFWVQIERVKEKFMSIRDNVIGKYYKKNS
jgi:hypothetical protein